MNKDQQIRNRPIEVYAEATPNPDTLKFVCSKVLLAEGSVEYKSKEEALESPLALELFSYSGITEVFITANFITLTKQKGMDWYEINSIMREVIKQYLSQHLSVFSQKPTVIHNDAEKKDLSEQEQKIVSLLEEYIKPAVESDGGAIDFKSFKDGVLTLTLRGACSGCPSSTVTLKSGIETLFKKLMPEVEEVVSEAG